MINNNKQGSVVKSPLIPEGNNATHYDQYGVGGYREVETIQDLQYINKKYLTIGCLVYVNENKQIYQYTKENTFEILYKEQWDALKKNIKDIIEVNKQQQDNINSNLNKIINLTNIVDQIPKNYKLELNNSDTNQISLTNSTNNSSSTVSIPIASTTRPGEIKLGDTKTLDTENTKNYPVQLDDKHRAYVNVPWKDTVPRSKSYKLALRAAKTNNIVLSDNENKESAVELPVATTTQLGEIKLGNPNLSLIKDRHYPVQYSEENGAFVQVPWTDTKDTDDITSQFTQFVFTRRYTKPNTPTGGSYDNPIPTTKDVIWTDSIPSGKDPVWCSHAIFINRNITNISWSDPILLTDTANIDICYSDSDSRPDPPTTHGIQNTDIWHNDPIENDIWMAISTRQSITLDWDDWKIFRIKGENGKDGTSLNIVGTYDNNNCLLWVRSNSNIVLGISNANIKFTDSKHKKSVGDCLQVLDTCSETSLNNHIICLTDNNPETWIDLGNIQGKNGIDGKSSYVHVKWSNNVIIDAQGNNTNPNATFTQPGDGETPGIYRGEYVDNIPQDSTTINDYKWVKAKGEDGFSYWFFYTATSVNTAPTNIPIINSASDLQQSKLTANGTTWYDEIPTNKSIYDPETQYLWQIWSRDDESVLTFRGPILVQAPSSDGVAYNIVVHNSGIYYDTDDDSLVAEKSSSEVTWDVYKNESLLEISDPYSIKYVWSNNEPGTGSEVTSTNIQHSAQWITIQLLKYGTKVFEQQYIFPIKGRQGEQGIPGQAADTGITIVLSNDVGHIACNPDNSPITNATTSTDIQIFKGETNITSHAIIVDSADSQGTSSITSYTSNDSHVSSTVEYSTSQNKFTFISSLQDTDTLNFQYLVPIYIKYNDYIYTKYFTIRKDYIGDVYELLVTPQVYTDDNTNDSLHIQVVRTYSRTGNKTGVITDTSDPAYGKLKITIDNGDQQDIIGYPDTKLTKSSFNIKLFENGKLIDEEVIARVSNGLTVPGAQGIQGCILRNRGYWDSSVSDYVNMGEYTPSTNTEIRYIDYVFIKGEEDKNKCYLVNYYSKLASKSHISGTDGRVILDANINPKDNCGSGGYWIESDTQELAYIKNLIAQNISAQTISSDEFLVKRTDKGNTEIVAGMVKGDANTTKTEDNVVFFAGTSAPDKKHLDTTKAKTYITEGGKLHSEDADIVGNVQASQLIIKANTTNLTQDDKVTPSIIFTTYEKTATVYSYKSDGTPITDITDTNKPVSMESFTNLKDTNGKNLADGSPVGIVYSLNSDNIYVPTYFFDFAPLISNTFTAASGYYTHMGDTDEAKVLISDNKLYYNSNTLYNGYLWCNKYAYIPSAQIPSLNLKHELVSGYIWYKVEVSNGIIGATISEFGINITEKYTKNSDGTYTMEPGASEWVTDLTTDTIYNNSDTYPTNSNEFETQYFMGQYGTYTHPTASGTKNVFYPLSYDFSIKYNNKPIVLDLNYLKSAKGFVYTINTNSNTVNNITYHYSDCVLNVSKLGNIYKCILGITDDNIYGMGTDNYTIVALNAIVLTQINGKFSINTEEIIGNA